jgi:SH3 domain-containing YSC84-like protein 1
MLSWLRSQRLFASVALEGATLRQDLDDNATLYGRNSKIGNCDTGSACAQGRIALLNRYSAKERTD